MSVTTDQKFNYNLVGICAIITVTPKSYYISVTSDLDQGTPAFASCRYVNER